MNKEIVVCVDISIMQGVNKPLIVEGKLTLNKKYELLSKMTSITGETEYLIIDDTGREFYYLAKRFLKIDELSNKLIDDINEKQ